MNNARFLFDATVTGSGLKLISAEPSVRKQGNGNFTGFIRNTWSDGTVTNDVFVENAPSVDEVRDAYARRGV